MRKIVLRCLKHSVRHLNTIFLMAWQNLGSMEGGIWKVVVQQGFGDKMWWIL